LFINWIAIVQGFTKLRLFSYHIFFVIGISFYFSSLDSHYPLKFLKPRPEIYTIQEAIQKIPPFHSVQASHHVGIFLNNQNPLYPLSFPVWKEYILFHPSPFLAHEKNHDMEEFLKNEEKIGEIYLIYEKNSVKLYRKKTH
jgi:hypothetical protein